jgi:hypothetical protein
VDGHIVPLFIDAAIEKAVKVRLGTHDRPVVVGAPHIDLREILYFYLNFYIF